MSVARFVESFKRREEDLFRQADFNLHEKGIILDDSFLYGEFAFLLLGLKPCVLIQFPEPFLTMYRRHVLDPVCAESGVQVTVIEKPLRSPETSLQGSILLSRRDAAVVASLLDDNSNKTTVAEAELAQILDYPGRLPETLEQVAMMREVAYLEASSMRLLTSFAVVGQEQVEATKRHFARYRQACLEHLNMDLRLLIRRPVA